MVIVFNRANTPGDPNIVVGGEAQLPVDTSTHAPEFAGFVGPEFNIGKHFILGFHAQVRKIYPPTSDVNGLFFPRYKMLLLEIPAVAEYHFGSSGHAFIRAQVSPEFAPALQPVLLRAIRISRPQLRSRLHHSRQRRIHLRPLVRQSQLRDPLLQVRHQPG